VLILDHTGIENKHMSQVTKYNSQQIVSGVLLNLIQGKRGEEEGEKRTFPHYSTERNC
jgi:hypothetical protein